jgi:hypothetical protein
VAVSVSSTPENDRTSPAKSHHGGFALMEEIVRDQLRAMRRGNLDAAKAIRRPTYLRWMLTQLPHDRPKGHTYFLQMEVPIDNPPVKIGFSARPSERIETFGCGSPYPLRFLGSFPNALLPEKTLHQRYRHLRLRGEWFTPDTELESLLDAVRAIQC